MGIIIKTAVWGYNNEWYPVTKILKDNIKTNKGSIRINVYCTEFLDTPTLNGIVKELRITYSKGIKHFAILVQEDPRPNKGTVLHIDGTTGEAKITSKRNKLKTNGLFVTTIQI